MVALKKPEARAATGALRTRDRNMIVFDMLEYLPLLNSIPPGLEHWNAAGVGILPGLARRRGDDGPALVQEQPGFYLGIAPDMRAAARDAARFAADRYAAWLDARGNPGETEFRKRHFTIAVGGGNTVKNEYKALLKYHVRDFDWIDHVRFFLLEETCNTSNWESARDGLVSTFIEPLARRLIVTRGARELTEQLELGRGASYEEITRRIVERMVFPIDMRTVEKAAKRGDRDLAVKHAKQEAQRYQRLLRQLLGPSMAFDMIISGVGKDGGIGAFSPYTPELKTKKPGVLAIEKADGAISVTLNRGFMTAADGISLIISGSLKLRALGRFEMEDSAAFEQTVMETPIRMLRETPEIAQKVYIFADDRALLFEEGSFSYQQNGKTIEIKSEVRDGDEEHGVHILLVHGFMGLYSYINLLIRLPSAWRVSALRRGTHAKTLPDAEVFPHYADTLRKMILQNWRSKRPTPICCHSFAGSISDHLLLSVLDDYGGELPDYRRLKAEDRRLVDAMRAAGIIHIATWAPSDICHIKPNIASLRARRRGKTPPESDMPEQVYEFDSQGRPRLNREHAEGLMSTPAALEKMMKLPGIEGAINALNLAVRHLVSRVDLQKLMKQQESPYGHRLLGGRVLKKVSFYGVLKEINAALHDPHEYQNRHLRALDAVVKYDIPCLVIVHRDDMMVSATRHQQEHEYLLAQRLKKERVKRERDLQVPVSLLLLEPDEPEPSDEFVDPHFLILSTTKGGGSNARKVTAAITAFVNDNVARAMRAGKVKPLASVDKRVLSSGG
jgi:6-phosphogluconolactonase/glucosamine-6-phosphate isomerase/deaminase